MRHLIIVLACAAGPAFADLEPAELKLSPAMTTLMSTGLDAAATQLAITFEKYAENGETIVLSNIENVAALETTERRAGKVYNYLSVDLNWDGKVTREELERVFATPERQGFVDGYLTDGDLDGNGEITLSEMIADAQAEYPDTGMSRNGYLREMMGWDLNGDGLLHFEEVLSVVQAHQK